MEKSAAVVADTLGITKGIDLMKDAGKVTGGMMKVLEQAVSPFCELLMIFLLVSCFCLGG